MAGSEPLSGPRRVETGSSESHSPVYNVINIPIVLSDRVALEPEIILSRKSVRFLVLCLRAVRLEGGVIS